MFIQDRIIYYPKEELLIKIVVYICIDWRIHSKKDRGIIILCVCDKTHPVRDNRVVSINQERVESSF